MWHVGIDVGGTFTDLFAANGESGETISAKVLTTAGDRSVGVLNALEAAAIAPAEISVLVHGTTTATNALATSSRSGASAASTCSRCARSGPRPSSPGACASPWGAGSPLRART